MPQLFQVSIIKSPKVDDIELDYVYDPTAPKPLYSLSDPPSTPSQAIPSTQRIGTSGKRPGDEDEDLILAELSRNQLIGSQKNLKKAKK